jgi:hypothetical protein
MALTDHDRIKFGAHKGKPLGSIEPSYFQWLYNTHKVTPDMKEYIENRLKITPQKSKQ